MDREYLLQIINTNFHSVLLSKDEIAQKVKQNSYFKEYEVISELLERQDAQLNNIDRQPFLHIYYWELVKSIMDAIRKADLSPKDENTIADAALLVISIYKEYSAVFYPFLMYSFLRLVLKEKILLV